jgi:hypothetical protein
MRAERAMTVTHAWPTLCGCSCAHGPAHDHLGESRPVASMLPMVLPMVGTLNEGVKPVETHRPSRFDGILRVQGEFLCVSKTEG